MAFRSRCSRDDAFKIDVGYELAVDNHKVVAGERLSNYIERARSAEDRLFKGIGNIDSQPGPVAQRVSN